MKKIRYSVLGYLDVSDPDTKEVCKRETVSSVIVEYSPEAEEAVKAKAYNGEYEIYDDAQTQDETPTQLDIIEAQVTYTAMMTDTLLEV